MTTRAESPPSSAPRAPEPEQRFVLYDVPWSTYVVLRDSLDD
jgi:hypothetical protein